ncbi:uncharacterized protein LOC134297176 [Anolis carolinensis]|uniref:uncharacterized protein LOC134297176 n=1 Tax=Anolis carolinensis TaxID=28377 RepID=UPI002F2B65DD
MESCAAGETSLKAVLEERFSASALRVLRAEAEGLRERLVSAAVRGRKRLRRRVTVGRTPLGECLRQLEQTRRQWEAKARGEPEGTPPSEEAQGTLLNLLEKGLALVERDGDSDGEEDKGAARDGPGTKYRKEKEAEEDPGEEEGHHGRDSEGGDTHEGDGDSGGNNEGEHHDGDGDGEEDKGAARDGPGTKYRKEKEAEEDPGEEEGHHGRDSEGGDTHEGDGDSGGNNEGEHHDGDGDGEEDKGAARDGPGTKYRKEKEAEEDPGEEDEDNESHTHEGDGDSGGDSEHEPHDGDGDGEEDKGASSDGPGTKHSKGKEAEEDPGEEEGDHGSISEGGDTHEGYGDSSGSSGGEDPDGDEDQEDTEVSLSDEDKSAICGYLLKKLDIVEQEVDTLKDPSQKKADTLRKEAEFLREWYRDISLDMEKVLKEKVLHLWSALWLNSLQAMTALQEVLSQFSAVEVASLKAESDFLQGFLQAAQREETLAELSNFYCSLDVLQESPLLKMDPTYGDLLKEGDAIKDTWCSALLRVLLKEGQEKTTALHKKVDTVQGISLEQKGELRAKMDALQKQMGLLWEVPLKEITAMLAMAYKLSCKLSSGLTKEEDTIWKKACGLAVTPMVNLKDVFLWKKVSALQATLHDIPVEKLMMLEKKVKLCIRKANVLQEKIWKPLKEELEILEEKLDSLKDSSQKEPGELQEELYELQNNLVELMAFETYPLKEAVKALKKRMNALQKKMNVPQKAGAPLKKRVNALQKKMNVPQKAGAPLKKRVNALQKKMNVPQKAGAPLKKRVNALQKKMNVPQKAGAPLKKRMNALQKKMNVPQKAGAPLKKRVNALQKKMNVPQKAGAPLKKRVNALQKKMNVPQKAGAPLKKRVNALQKKMNVPQKAGAPLEEGDEAMQGDKTGFPEMLNAQDAGCAPHSAAQKRPPCELQVTDDSSKALQETTCVEGSGESLAGCEPALTEGEGSEPPRKKQRMNPTGGTQEPSLTQELFAVLQKHISLTINQSMEKLSNMVSKLHGTALKDTEEAKALMAALEKALALLRLLLENA